MKSEHQSMASTSFTFVTKEKFDELIEEYLRVDVK